MKKSSLFFFALLMISSTVFGQIDMDDDSWSIRNRGFLGFGLTGLSLGSSPGYGKYFTVGVSGQVGYMLTENLSSGIGVDFEYTSYSDQHVKLYSTGTYPFLRYNIKQFFVQTEYAVYNLKATTPTQELKQSADRFFVGIGYFSDASRRGKVNLLVSYDVLYLSSGLFPSPLSIRVFYTFH